MVPGVPCRDHGNWDEESLLDRSHACLAKKAFRAFPKRVGPRILLLETVDYFGTSEHDLVVEKKNKNRNEQNAIVG